MRFSLAVIAAFILVAEPGARAGDYAYEINVLRENERIFVEEASEKILLLRNYEIVAQRLKEVLATVSNPSGVNGTRTGARIPGISDSRNALIQVTQEQARVEVALKQLEIVEPTLNRVAQDLAAAAARLPEMAAANDTMVGVIRAELAAARGALEKRKAVAEQAVDRWVQWQVRLYEQTKIAERYEILSDLRFQDALSEIREPLVVANMAALGALESGDVRQAQDILAAMGWLRSVTPAFLAGMLTTPDRKARMEALLRDGVELEQRLGDSIAEFIQSRIDQGLPLEKGSPGGFELFSAFGKGNRSARYAALQPMAYVPVLDEFEKVPEPEASSDESVRRVRVRDDFGFLKDREVLVNGSEDKRIRYATPADSIEVPHFIAVDDDKVQDHVPMERGPRFKERVKKELQKKLADLPLLRGGPSLIVLPVPPEPIEDLPPLPPTDERAPVAERLDHLRKMVDHERDRAQRPDDKQELAQVKAEVERTQRQLKVWQAEVDRSTARVLAARDIAAGVAKLLEDNAEAAPPDLGIPPESGDPTEEQLKELTKTIADIAISSIPGIGNVYNMAGFINALVTGQDLMGRPTAGVELAILGAAVILPFTKGFRSLAKSAAVVSRINAGKAVAWAGKFESPAGRALLYSGLNGKEEWGKLKKLIDAGYVTIGETRAGRILSTIMPRLEERHAMFPEVERVWKTGSIKFVEGAQGEVSFVLGSNEGRIQRGLFKNVEAPILQQRGIELIKIPLEEIR